MKTRRRCVSGITAREPLPSSSSSSLYYFFFLFYLYYFFFLFFGGALRPQKPQGLLGTRKNMCRKRNHTKAWMNERRVYCNDGRMFLNKRPTFSDVLANTEKNKNKNTNKQKKPTTERRKLGGGGVGWGGVRVPMRNSSKRLNTQRRKRPSATTRTTTLRRWGPRQCQATCVLR